MDRTVTAEGTGAGPLPPYRPPGCLNCGPVELSPVFDGELTNFYCPLCGSCWHFELGFVVPIHPDTCPGCQIELVCRERSLAG
jgi:hypothetical protein